jgi:hypothetical protein
VYLVQTDIPLKRLTTLRGADLLPLLGLPAATLIQVETRELPASATRLDNVLRIRSPQGQEYLHLVEWQGYRDPAVLWRLASYQAWFGQQEPDITVVGTIVYLSPEYDFGDKLTQVIDGQIIQTWQFARIRLWEQDAQVALESNSLGLVVLSPLMRNADEQLVRQAIDIVVRQAPMTQQSDLLSILGTFAMPFFQPDYFVALVGREKLMSSDLFDYLMRDLIAEHRAERSVLEARLQAQEAQQALEQVLEETLIQRFPEAPLALIRDIHRVQQPARLQQLIIAVPQVADLDEFRQLLQQAAAG